MRKSLLTIIGSLLVGNLLMSLSGCHKDPECEDPKTNYHYLTDDQKAAVPYSGTDTLRFLHNGTDTQIFIGQGKQPFYTRVQRGMDCPGDIEMLEGYNTVYKAKTFNKDIYFSAALLENFNGICDIEVRFQAGVFFQTTVVMSAPFNLDSIFVINRYYKNITYLPPQSPDTLFYSREYGIVKISFANGEIWELLKYYGK